MQVGQFPASAANSLIEGYCDDFVSLAAVLAQTLEQVSMRDINISSSRPSLQRIEDGMRQLAGAIHELLERRTPVKPPSGLEYMLADAPPKNAPPARPLPPRDEAPPPRVGRVTPTAGLPGLGSPGLAPGLGSQGLGSPPQGSPMQRFPNPGFPAKAPSQSTPPSPPPSLPPASPRQPARPPASAPAAYAPPPQRGATPPPARATTPASSVPPTSLPPTSTPSTNTPSSGTPSMGTPSTGARPMNAAEIREMARPVAPAAQGAAPAAHQPPPASTQPAATTPAATTPANQPAAGQAGPDAKTPAEPLKGTSQSMPVRSVFQFLGRMRKSGTMFVQVKQEQLTFEFHHGSIVYTSSSEAPLNERLGELLVELGFCTAAALQPLLAECNTSGSVLLNDRLGRLVIEQHVATNGQVLEALEQQVKRRFSRACECATASYEFVEGQRRLDDGRIRIAPMELTFSPSVATSSPDSQTR